MPSSILVEAEVGDEVGVKVWVDVDVGVEVEVEVGVGVGVEVEVGVEATFTDGWCGEVKTRANLRKFS